MNDVPSPSARGPLILSTWSAGMPANAAAWADLAGGGAAIDAVEAAARFAEGDPNNRTVGFNALPDRAGNVSLDAAIMLAPDRAGSVCQIRHYMHPVSIARRVMEKTQHRLFSGDGAEALAHEAGFEKAELLTDASRYAWLKWKEANAGGTSSEAVHLHANIEEANHDTIGILALDAAGTLAGACSTSGLAWKVPGRVGDSPIIGHGLYVHPRYGAAVATGHGELIMGICGTFLAVEQMRRGASPRDAAVEVLNRIAESYDLTENDQVGLIVLSPSGEWIGASLRPGFKISCRNESREHLLDPTFSIFP